MQDEQQAYSVSDFCRVYAISRKALYDLWKAGQGPISYKIGRSRRVSRRAAEAWQRALEPGAVISSNYVAPSFHGVPSPLPVSDLALLPGPVKPSSDAIER